MFKSKMFGNKIISDEGYEIHLGTEGRGTLIYLEHGRKMLINSETLSVEKGMGIAFWKDSIQKWDPPFENEAISNEKRNEIIVRVENALKFAKFTTVHVI